MMFGGFKEVLWSMTVGEHELDVVVVDNVPHVTDGDTYGVPHNLVDWSSESFDDQVDIVNDGGEEKAGAGFYERAGVSYKG
jgi:hypothetical protein